MSADSGCCGGLECDCVPDIVKVHDARGNVIAVRGGRERKPYVGMGVHYAGRAGECLVAFVAIIRDSGLTLAVLHPEGTVFDGDVHHSPDRAKRSWHHIHEET